MKTAPAQVAAFPNVRPRNANTTATNTARTITARPNTARLLVGVVVSVLFLLSATTTRAASNDLALPKAQAEMTSVDWTNYSQRLVASVRSGNDGVVRAALRLSIQYASVVDVDDAIVDMMRVYRNHSDERVRHLAAVALASTGNRLALGYLRLSLEHEKSPTIKRTIKAATSGTS